MRQGSHHLRQASASPITRRGQQSSDYLAYLAATGADPAQEVDASTLRLAFATLDLLIIAVATPESERILPVAELPGLRSRMNDALLELVYDDPFDAWSDTPVLELGGPLDSRLEAILHVLGRASAGPDSGTTGAGGGRP